jgi:hypothetical protein
MIISIGSVGFLFLFLFLFFISDFVFRMCRENVGLVGLTRVGSRRVVQISAAFMLFFSIFGTVLLYPL